MEAQIETAETHISAKHVRLTPDELVKSRLRESIKLSRNRVMTDLQQSSNPRYQKMLNDALVHLDAKLAELE